MEDIIDIIVTETTNLIEITSQPTDEVIDVNIIDNRENITLNVTPSVVEININQLTGNFGVLWGEITGTLSSQTDLQNALNLKADLVDGKVPSSQLPSYVDDVVEVANYASLPVTGEVGKIYITLDTNFIYRWTGSTYVEIKDSSAVWGAITGTLSSQTDLQSALNAKEPTITAGTTLQYWRGDKSWQTLNTTIVPEGTNLYYTDARARAAISAGTGISYSSSTGVIASTITQYTDALARAAVSLTTTGSNGSATYNSTTGVLNVPTYTLSGLGGQPLATNLTALAGLSYSSLGFIKMTGVGTFALDTNTFALDSAVVHNTGNETIAGQKTFSSTIYGAGAVFSAALVAQSINITGITASPSVYITTNGTNHAVSIVQSGTGYAIYASGNVAVIGTGYFSSSLTAASLSSTAGYNYTLPSASGTLALTSNLSSYLPLSGGTLTGALSGTSATFSSSVSSVGVKTNGGGNINIVPTSYGGNGSVAFRNIADSATRWNIYNYTGGGTTYGSLNFSDGGGTDRLVINEGGAATFSSTITAGGKILTTASGNDTFGFQMYKSGTTTTLAGFYQNTTGDGLIAAYNSAGTQNIQLATNGTSYLNGGNVGIGTTSPVSIGGYTALTLNNATTGGILTFQQNGVNKGSIYNDGSSNIYIGVNSGATIFENGSERMRITSAGNVGIGTTSPSNRLSVFESTGTTTSTMDFSTTGNAIKGHIGMFANNFYITSNWFYNGTQTADNTGYAQNAISFDNTGFMSFQCSAAGSSNPTERMRITSGGKVMVHTTDSGPNAYLFASADMNQPYPLGAKGESTNQGLVGFFDNGNSVIGSISKSGSVVSYNITSDYRLKQDFKSINGLDLVNRINVYNYEWKSDNTRMDGVIAHELQEILPYAVTGIKDGKEMQSVDYSKIVPVMVQAIKELKAELDTLKNK